ncbi:hypothetical protein THAOC_05233 [Thalassiosira oceanica]|uniref:Uncharacterized protein n=1 Tax=Thalassiosira oceanica TaxID=159749 RepID=K0T661_THAOC|nr:hypothetical protein THAOC_05233 [Thalassiosira oceanica]|eukprot:EJK73160.1 hypothetical protein THAOC_05233 [Thalassiosira oceanica]
MSGKLPAHFGQFIALSPSKRKRIGDAAALCGRPVYAVCMQWPDLRTPGGGGSTERPPSSTRSFSSHSPPGVDPNAPQLDAATLAKIVATALPAAVALFNRLRDVYVTSTANDGVMGEHVTYLKVLSSPGPEIEGLLTRIIYQLTHSKQDLTWMRENLQDEHLRIMESLTPTAQETLQWSTS